MTGPEHVARWASVKFQKELKRVMPELDPSRVFMAGVRAIRARVLGLDPLKAAKDLVRGAADPVEAAKGLVSGAKDVAGDVGKKIGKLRF